MYSRFGFLFLLLSSSLVHAADLGKAHTYKLADLQKAQPIVASTADLIIVVEECKPDEAEQFTATSDNPYVKVRAVAMGGEMKIVITGDQKGEATVSWYFKVKGTNSGFKGLKIKFQ